MNHYLRGLRAAVPIALGYFPVSFGFGILAVANGLSPALALFISMTNLTSAGQVAGVSVLASGGGGLEMALSQLVINLRYALMSLTLSQTLKDGTPAIHRPLMAFGITDEIFALAAEQAPLTPAYFYGLMTLPYLGWASGTLFGALLGGILPALVRDALGIAIYGMFLAIVLPKAKRHRGVLFCAAVSAVFSCIFAFVPCFSAISPGFSIILCALAASLLAALLFPVAQEDKEGTLATAPQEAQEENP